MPKGYGVGLRVATIPIAGVEPLSDQQGETPGGGGGTPPSSGGGGVISGGGSSGGLGGIGLIGLLILALGVGVPLIVASPDNQQAQVAPSDDQNTSMIRVYTGGSIAE